MSEVSCRVVSFGLDWARRRGVPDQVLLAGLSVSPDQVRGARGRISWDDFTMFAERLQQLCGGPDQLARLARAHLSSPRFGFLAAMGRLFARPRDLYWMGVTWLGPALFSITKDALEDLPDGRLRETVEIPPGYRDSPPFFHAMLGALRAAPHHLGRGDAEVEMDLAPRRAVYTIALPHPPGLWTRARRALGCFAAARGAVEELRAQHEQLRASDQELGAARVRIASQAARLERIEWQIRDYDALLESQVIERKRAEAERCRLEGQLLRAQRLESLGVMAGGIAHDFNNLLIGIQANAEMALKEIGPRSPVHGLLADIERASERAADLTRQLLAYAGGGELSVEALNLSALVGEMVHLLRRNVPPEVVLDFATPGDLPWIRADATQIRQLVMNLITNAAEALGSEGGVVAVRTGVSWLDRSYLDDCLLVNDLPEGGYAQVEVRDTGSGMDRETLERIFDPFFTTKRDGRGLGLAAVLGVLRRHRGTLRVESTPGQGTTFRVFFPCIGEPTAPAQ